MSRHKRNVTRKKLQWSKANAVGSAKALNPWWRGLKRHGRVKWKSQRMKWKRWNLGIIALFSNFDGELVDEARKLAHSIARWHCMLGILGAMVQELQSNMILR